MKSLDTNLLIYAANRAAPEHPQAIALVNELLAKPSDWMIADQVLWEFYKALRHPRILEKPCTASQAATHVRFLREQSGAAHCTYESDFFADVLSQAERPQYPYQRIHDLILGVTLVRQGVDVFYTRNTKDFAGVGFRQIINPID